MTGARGGFRRGIVAVGVVVVVGSASTASYGQSEGFRLQRSMAPPSPHDGLAMQLPQTLGQWRWSAALGIGLQYAPLVSGQADPMDDIDIVGQRVFARAAFSLGISDAVDAFVSLPFVMTQSGDDPGMGNAMFRAPSTAGVGDLALGASVAVFRTDGGLSVGTVGSISLPTGQADALTGDDGLGGQLTAMVAYPVSDWLLAMEIGVGIHPERDYGALALGSELIFRAGAHYRVSSAVRALFELDGSTWLRDGQAFDEHATPLAVLAGLRYVTSTGLSATIGAGPGLNVSPTLPAFTAVVSLGWEPQEQAVYKPDRLVFVPMTPPVPESPLPPPARASATADRDGDGIADADDKCMHQKEDVDQFEDGDGCPDDDNDGDGVADANDQCPNASESANGFRDHDGCPDSHPKTAMPAPVSFSVASARLRPNETKRLRQLAVYLERHPEVRLVRIHGHSSADGQRAFNLALSRRRARAVVRWLVRTGGVDRKRLEIVAHGANTPLASDTDPSPHKDRRVEFELAELSSTPP